MDSWELCNILSIILSLNMGVPGAIGCRLEVPVCSKFWRWGWIQR